MIKGNNIERLLICIIFVVMVLCSCVTFDFAENTTISNLKCTDDIIAEQNVTVLNKSSVIGVNSSAYDIVVKSSDKVYMKYPVVGMYAKPSCGCGYSYKYWYYREFIDYCPNCHHYGVLVKNPKGTYEKEWTCKQCSSDFCGVCGKEKYSWSNVYLRKC